MVKSLMMLWLVLLDELGQRSNISTSRDGKTAAARFEHEGISFLTITLPAFCKDFERSLEEGKVADDLFAGFKRSGGLPRFLGGFLQLVFDRGSGCLVQTPDMDSILAIRQLTASFGKILLPCSDARKEGAIFKYLDCEREVRSADASTSEHDRNDLARISALLFRDVYTRVDSDVYQGNIMGRHGPGSTADKLTGNRKYDLTEWPVRLETEFPYGEFAVPSPRYNYLYQRVSLLEPGTERPVKVVLVPKTLKTPRVIAIEPTAIQFMQQGLMEKLVGYLERDRFLNGMIGFLDQSPNQALARRGSINKSLATLDLSEASDRVSNQHVTVMLQRFPSFLRAVDATRSRTADVPGHGVIPLAKFASMGSALCFPFEAMVFLSLIFLGIERELIRKHKVRHQITRRDVSLLSSQVRVYGDDMIVPVDYVQSVIQTLEDFGFRVNTGKSFWNGKFRESCGREYYDGEDVSIVRVRRNLPTSLTDVQEIISTVSLRNQLYFAGLWKTAGYLDRILEPLLVHYPVVAPDVRSISFTGKVQDGSPLLGRQSFLAGSQPVKRIDRNLHVPLVRGYQVVAKSPRSQISGEGALLKWFLKRGEQPFADRDHLERQGRPAAVRIKLRWKQPF